MWGDVNKGNPAAKCNELCGGEGCNEFRRGVLQRVGRGVVQRVGGGM